MAFVVGEPDLVRVLSDHRTLGRLTDVIAWGGIAERNTLDREARKKTPSINNTQAGP